MAQRQGAQRDSTPARISTVAVLDVDPVRLVTRSVYRGWLVLVEWLTIDGRLEPVDLSVSATNKEMASSTHKSDGGKLQGEGQRALNADVVRRLPIGEMIAEGRVALTNLRENRPLIRPESRYQELWPDDLLGEDVDIGKSQRGRTLTAENLEQVATVYRKAWAEGKSVNEAVRETFTLSKDGAAKRIGKARKAGLLDGIGPKR